MRRLPICFRQMSFICCILGVTLTSCVGFDPVVQSEVEDLKDRPTIAILPFGFDLEITKLSAVKTVEGPLSPEDEATQIAEALREIQQEARWLLVSRLATGYGFRFVPLEQTDALADELQLKPGALPNADQLTEFRRRLGADLVVAGSGWQPAPLRTYRLKPSCSGSPPPGTRCSSWPMQVSKCSPIRPSFLAGAISSA